MQRRPREILKTPVGQSKVVGPLNSPAESKEIFFSAIVIDRNDPTESNMIRVRIESIDKNINDLDLPWCVSLMPSYFFCVPMVGEHVIVFLQNPWTGQKGRFYFGPIRSGHVAEFEPYRETITNLGLDKRGL